MAKRVRVSPSEFREKHARRTVAAVEDMRRGINRVTEPPGQAAAAKKDKLRAKLLAKIDDGTWERRVASVSLEDWKASMLNKGVGRVASGVEAAASKVEDFAAQLIEYENSLLSRIDGMPDLTLEDSIARAREWITGMSKFSRK